MFNKSKKYNIVKCLPFVCFANININAEGVKSGDGQITLVVDGETYTLDQNIEIIPEGSTLKLDDILKSDKYKKTDTFTEQPLKDKKLDTDYIITGYLLGTGYAVGAKIADSLKEINAASLGTNKLTINVSTKFTLADDSALIDAGGNIIKIAGKIFTVSKLKSI